GGRRPRPAGPTPDRTSSWSGATGPSGQCRAAFRPRLGRVGNEPTYEAAGVSLTTAGAVVERLRAAVESTGAQGFGAFAGLYPLDDRRMLAASMDSIGTKPMVARARGRLRNCGADIAAPPYH